MTYFSWRDEATALVCAAMRRLAEHYPIGCPTAAPDWEAADDAVTDAYWSGDLDALRGALARHEAVAQRHFGLYAAGLRRPGRT